MLLLPLTRKRRPQVLGLVANEIQGGSQTAPHRTV